VVLEQRKTVTVECIRTGGTMDAFEHIAAKLVATKRWRIMEPEPVAVAPAVETAPAPSVASKTVPKFGEDHED
jgi:hypothetical protein